MATLQEKRAARKMAAEVVRTGEKLILPANMSAQDAKQLLEDFIQFETTMVDISEQFDVFPWDGAIALDTVLTRRYGWAPATPTPGFFRDNPPQLMTVEVGPKQVRQVPWGRFLLPNVKGHINTGYGRKGRRYVFAVSANVARKDEATIRALYDELREEIATNSIYRGKAISLRFRDEDGDELQLAVPSFMDVSDIDRSQLVYRKDVERAVWTNLFVPICRARDCIANGISLKRGILLGGDYGTGKTLAARVASRLAVDTGLTYIYVKRADELADAIEFAKQYQSPGVVVFCEDIDRVISGERSVAMDDILNIIDGIDSKSHNIIVVVTTNDLEAMNPAMLRHGRLTVIEIPPPDAEAVERLLRIYGRGVISPQTDLAAVGIALAGNIPATIAEVVTRAKLAQLSTQEIGTKVSELTVEALLEAAESVSAQVDLVRRVIKKNADAHHVTDFERSFTHVVRGALDGEGHPLHEVRKNVRQIHDAVVDN